MADCCNDKEDALTAMRDAQSRTLKLVLAVNAIMFLGEFGVGIVANSTALLAESLDMLGDAIVYGFSLFVVTRDDLWKARAAWFKGGIMMLFGLFVLGEAALKFVSPVVPASNLMALMGVIALAANAWCLLVLTRHREEDVNMRSVWLCSRNDIIANTSVLAAAGGVFLLGSHWPDLIVGLAIATLFIRSAFTVFEDARTTTRTALERSGG